MVNYLARFSPNPNSTHWNALTKLIQYLRKTKNLALRLEPTVDEKHPLKTYVDANWGGEGARSSHGFIATLWGSPIHWGSRKQQCVAWSTCQAEYMALFYAATETLWLGNLAAKLIPNLLPIILCDNQAATKIASDKSSMKNTRHIDRKFHFINEHLRLKKLQLQSIQGTDQLADIFTKRLGSNQQQRFLQHFFKPI